MAFKLKSSPFNANVTTVKPTIQSSKLIGDSGNRLTSEGNSFMVPTAEADMEVNTQTRTNKTTEKLVKKADEGIPLGLNPKQEARFKTRKYKKGLRDDAKFDRQTRKAENIYEKNQFEKVNDEYLNPEKAQSKKIENQKRLEDAEIALKEYDLDNAIKSSPNNMNEMKKPNRAGTPARMLKSMEDTTPMKYKSVRKAGRENLMSALAKQGEPIDEIKSSKNYE